MAATPVYEKIPPVGIQMRTNTPCKDDRQWVPLMRSKYMRVQFANWDDAEEYVQAMRTLHPHIELRVAPLEWLQPKG